MLLALKMLSSNLANHFIKRRIKKDKFSKISLKMCSLRPAHVGY